MAKPPKPLGNPATFVNVPVDEPGQNQISPPVPEEKPPADQPVVPVQDEQEEERTPHEIWEAKKAFMEGQQYPFTEEEPKADEEKKPEGKSGSPPPPKSDEPKGKGKPAIKRKPVLEAEDIERTVSRAVNDAIDRREPKKPEEPQAKPAEVKHPEGLDLNEEDQEELEVLKKMASLDPKAKDLPDRMLKFWKDEQDYISKWERDHPDEQFDADASDHRAFYAGAPKVSRKEFKAAERRIIGDEVRESIQKEVVEKQVTPALERLQARELYREKSPEIHRETGEGVIRFVGMADDGIGKLMDQEDGGKVLNRDIAAKMQAEDPLAFDVINRQARILETELNELGKATKLGKFYKFRPDYSVDIDGESVYVHAEITNLANRMEEEQLAKPKAKQVWDGKQFITRSQFGQMMGQIDQGPGSVEEKALKRDEVFDRYWFVESGDIRDKLVEVHAAKAKKIITQLRSYTKSQSSKNGKPASQTPGTAATRKPTSSEETEPDNGPPSTSSSADTLANQNAGKNQSESQEELVMKNWA